MIVELSKIIENSNFNQVSNVKMFYEAFNMRNVDTGVCYDTKKIIGKKDYVDDTNYFEVPIYPYQEELISNITTSAKNCRVCLVVNGTEYSDLTDQSILLPFLCNQQLKIKFIFNSKEEIPIFFNFNYSVKAFSYRDKHNLETLCVNAGQFSYISRNIILTEKLNLQSS